MRSRNLALALALLGSAALATAVVARSADEFSLWWHVIAGGGGHATSPEYAVDGSIGQPATGMSSGGDYQLASGFWPGLGALEAPAALVVTTTDDTDDGTCDAAHCSLREALGVAANPGPDAIVFDIPTSDPGYNPATGVWTIKPSSEYRVPRDTIIDGTIKPVLASTESLARPGIELDGTTLAAQGITGLTVEDNVKLSGLVVNHFQYGIWIAAAGVTIEHCYVGTDPTGTSAKPNGLDGIIVAHEATGAVIQDNVLSGNGGRGIRMFGGASTGNTVRRNRIGTTADGMAALPNSGGVYVHAEAHDNTVGPDNLIAFNAASGVEVDGAGTRGNTISRNQVHSNAGPGIRLVSEGNDALAAPAITSASATLVAGTACADCVVVVFSDAEDEGAVYEGTATADGAGNWSLSKPAGFSGPNLTATATDRSGNTSAFSSPVSLPQASPTATGTLRPTAGATVSATVSPTGLPSATGTQSPPTVTPTPGSTVAASATPEQNHYLYLPLTRRGD